MLGKAAIKATCMSLVKKSIDTAHFLFGGVLTASREIFTLPVQAAHAPTRADRGSAPLLHRFSSEKYKNNGSEI
jgi:hypothetical protein